LATDGDPIWLPIPFFKKVQHKKGKKTLFYFYLVGAQNSFQQRDGQSKIKSPKNKRRIGLLQPAS
jgi:hypothetical protein